MGEQGTICQGVVGPSISNFLRPGIFCFALSFPRKQKVGRIMKTVIAFGVLMLLAAASATDDILEAMKRNNNNNNNNNNNMFFWMKQNFCYGCRKDCLFECMKQCGDYKTDCQFCSNNNNNDNGGGGWGKRSEDTEEEEVLSKRNNNNNNNNN